MFVDEGPTVQLAVQRDEGPACRTLEGRGSSLPDEGPACRAEGRGSSLPCDDDADDDDDDDDDDNLSYGWEGGFPYHIWEYATGGGFPYHIWEYVTGLTLPSSGNMPGSSGCNLPGTSPAIFA